jgi:hypothetical protein
LASCGALKQTRAEAIFKLAHILSNHDSGYFQPLRSLGEVTFLHDGNEGFHGP